MDTVQKRLVKETTIKESKQNLILLKKVELEEFVCPITQDIMENPYNTSCCGIDFEKSQLDYWYASNNKCPLNRCVESTTIENCNPSTSTRKKIITLKEDINKLEIELIQCDVNIKRFNDILSLCIVSDKFQTDTTFNILPHIESSSDLYCVKTGNNESDVDCIGLVIDISMSMSTINVIEIEGTTTKISNLEIVKQSAGLICTQLKNKDCKVFILTFGTKINVLSKPVNITDNNINEILMKISSMRTEGNTNMIGAIKKTIEFAQNTLMTRAIILTDGVPTAGYTIAYKEPGSNLSGISSATDDLIEKYNVKDKIRFDMIGLGKNLERQSMLSITDNSGGNYYYMYDYSMIPHVTTHILFNNLNICCKSTYGKITFNESITRDEMKIVTKYLDLNNYMIDNNILNIDLGSLSSNKENVFKLDNSIKPISYDFTLIMNNGLEYSIPFENFEFDVNCHNMRLNMVTQINNFIEQLDNRHISCEALIPHINSLIVSLEETNVSPINEQYKNALISDCKDQIFSGLTNTEYYKTWGHLHNSAALRNHFHMICSNFVQEAEQFYKTLQNRKFLQTLQQEWIDFELPLPNVPVHNVPLPNVPVHNVQIPPYRAQQNNNRSMSIMPEPRQEQGRLTRTVSESISRRVHDNGCFHEMCSIWISDNQFIKASELSKNMIVKDSEGNETFVECVTKMRCPDNNACISIYEDIALTPYHPICIEDNNGVGVWHFPIDLVGAENIQCNYVYNYILNNRGSLRVGEHKRKVCTLAHGLDGPVIGHKFFGTEEIVINLKSKWSQDYDRGLIDSINNIVRSPNTGRVIGYI